jgi:pyruvate,water dikinase
MEDALPSWDYWLTTWPDREVLLSRGNAADGYPKALTPLSQDLIMDFEDQGVRLFLEQTLKAQRPGDAPMPYFVSLWGHLYINADQHAGLGEAMPGNSRQATYRRYMGLEPDPSLAAPPAPRWQRLLQVPRKAGVVLRMTREAFRVPRRIDSEIARIRSLRRPPDIDLDGALAWVRQLEAVTPSAWETLILGAGIAGTVFGVTSRLIARATGTAPADLVNRLHTGLGGNESAEVGLAVRRLAEAGQRDPELAAALQSSAPLEQLAAIAPDFVAMFTAALERFGFHTAPELEVEQPTWRQDPQQLLNVIRQQLGVEHADDAAGQAQREGAQRELRSQVSPAWRPVIAIALYASRRLMPSRENSKIPAVLIFDELRRVVEVAGPLLEKDGVVAAPQDVVLLRYHELTEVLGGSNGPGLSELSRRREQLTRCRDLTLPELVEAGPEGARPLTEEAIRRRGMRPSVAPSQQANVLRGVAAGSGRAAGTVRILHDPYDDFAPGEILVARTVDPGWAGVLSCAGAIILDLGGTMSHGAMVARELGIPCVVGVRTASTVLHSGDTVTVDGTTGEITIEEIELSNMEPTDV